VQRKKRMKGRTIYWSVCIKRREEVRGLVMKVLVKKTMRSLTIVKLRMNKVRIKFDWFLSIFSLCRYSKSLKGKRRANDNNVGILLNKLFTQSL